MLLQGIRTTYHNQLCTDVIRISEGGYPNFADGSNRSSKSIAQAILTQLGCEPANGGLPSQTIGDKFEAISKDFISQAFLLLQHLRPGDWVYSTDLAISQFSQYKHLAELERLIEHSQELKATLGTDYIIKPDIVVGRHSISDDVINRNDQVLSDEDEIANLSPLRAKNSADGVLLHASISCKWTIRSDRTQNIRTEAQNLIRNRKGNLPHVVALTAEPLPSRIAALAFGTGDLDCVYHFALPELIALVEELENQDQLEMLQTLVDGERLRDISDLPFDLAI